MASNLLNNGNNGIFDINDIYINENSWADIVDTEISPHMQNKLLTSSSCDSIEKKNVKTIANITTYNIADIVSKNPETIDDITLLEWETYLSSHLKKYIKQCMEGSDKYNKFDYNLHIPKFEWLIQTSKFLSDKLGLIITNHNNNNFDLHKGIIPRSSYKFCEYNYDCQFNYKDKYNGCYAQHFVHNLVTADISAMIYYLKYIYETKKEYNYDELVKCITTIAYVIKHMYEELSNLYFHYGNINNFHIEKSKVKKKISYKKSTCPRNFKRKKFTIKLKDKIKR